MSDWDVEISIATDNNRAGLRACLTSIPGSASTLRIKTWVIDNVTTDGTAEMLAADFPGAAVITNTQRRGFGANHNQVIGPAVAGRRAPFVLVLNDDTELAEGSLQLLVDALRAAPGTAAMVPAVYDPQRALAASRLAYPSAASSWRFDWTSQSEGPDMVGGWLQGCCLLLRCEAIAAAGAFDERFFLFYEDADLSRRLDAAGWRLGECRESTIVHAGHQSVLRADMIDFTRRQGLRSRYLYFAKHAGRGTALFISAVGRCLLALRAARGFCSGSGRAEAMSLLRLAAYDPRKAPSLPPRGAPGGQASSPS